MGSSNVLPPPYAAETLKATDIIMCDMASTATEIERLKREFLEHTEIAKGRAVKTIENYDHYLKRFIEYSKVKKASDITEDTVRDFRLWLNRQSTGHKSPHAETLSRKTQNYYLIALRA